ncbi:2-C-methyl-D-erythritol 2,4-cyclodiphosphate synthase [Candidatus Kinetoplastibacterium sorsogonicusi]|uniref:2-C-methyl-D-erythritol 2,4-cyclodiphosphate synthase n=1 Tax=Candidatus Kinetoplastidibacterium kentomonadis TaxID=1576550 RepID=A0A3Q8ETU4_9PROT|nr:2-C-methyl-D-erythritol 2,4-cyclodiphosphate synthase [Candidatus Kinetoplastibacterium sorsogonicusi]AWD32580.1 2-C-methyl-D-erythritol 2,4-cyclodiphosphate synthase [Candidatus Kinetoplastibacterium sorsogonicusi]
MDFNIRIGQGFDVHKLVKGRNLIIGGVDIPYHKGLLGHSDADVLLHAISDSLLGAASMGDIGQLFPDSDLEYKNINSRKILKNICDQLKNKGLKIINIDATIHAQAPMMKPHIPFMIENISKDLNLSYNNINIKSKTNENLGYIGKSKGIAASAISLISYSNS